MGQIGGQIRDRYGIGPKGPVYKGATRSGVHLARRPMNDQDKQNRCDQFL